MGPAAPFIALFTKNKSWTTIPFPSSLLQNIDLFLISVMYREHAITMGQPLASQLSVLGRYVEVRFLPQ